MFPSAKIETRVGWLKHNLMLSQGFDFTKAYSGHNTGKRRRITLFYFVETLFIHLINLDYKQHILKIAMF